MPKATRRRAGRPTRQPNQGERVGLSLRVTADTKRNLDSAAAAWSRSLSQEAEFRLEQSFRDERRAELFSDLYFGRELAALLEILGRAIRDAGTHAAAAAARAGLGSPKWIENPHGFDIAIKAATRVLEQLRPAGKLEAPQPASKAEAMLGEAIADGLLAAVGHDKAPTDFTEEWAAGLRPRLGRLRTRLSGFDYTLGAHSASLPSGNLPGILLYDADDRSLLEEKPDRQSKKEGAP